MRDSIESLVTVEKVESIGFLVDNDIASDVCSLTWSVWAQVDAATCLNSLFMGIVEAVFDEDVLMSGEQPA